MNILEPKHYCEKHGHKWKYSRRITECISFQIGSVVFNGEKLDIGDKILIGNDQIELKAEHKKTKSYSSQKKCKRCGTAYVRFTKEGKWMYKKITDAMININLGKIF